MRSEWRGRGGEEWRSVKKGRERREGRERLVDLGEPRDTRRAEVTAFHYFRFSIGLISWRALSGTAKADGVISHHLSHLSCSRRRGGRLFRVAASRAFCLGWSLARQVTLRSLRNHASFPSSIPHPICQPHAHAHVYSNDSQFSESKIWHLCGWQRWPRVFPNPFYSYTKKT